MISPNKRINQENKPIILNERKTSVNLFLINKKKSFGVLATLSFWGNQYSASAYHSCLFRNCVLAVPHPCSSFSSPFSSFFSLIHCCVIPASSIKDVYHSDSRTTTDRKFHWVIDGRTGRILCLAHKRTFSEHISTLRKICA